MLPLYSFIGYFISKYRKYIICVENPVIGVRMIYYTMVTAQIEAIRNQLFVSAFGTAYERKINYIFR